MFNWLWRMFGWDAGNPDAAVTRPPVTGVFTLTPAVFGTFALTPATTGMLAVASQVTGTLSLRPV